VVLLVGVGVWWWPRATPADVSSRAVESTPLPSTVEPTRYVEPNSEEQAEPSANDGVAGELHWLTGVVRKGEVPVAHAEVFVDELPPGPSTKTDAQGRFRLEGIRGRAASIKATSGVDHLSGQLPMCELDRDVVIPVFVDPEISGRALDVGGVPIEVVVINGVELKAPGGHFVATIVRNREPLAMLVWAPGFRPKEVALPSLRAQVGDVVLERGRTLKGLIVDSKTSAGVAHAKVEVEKDPRSVTTDAEGHFECDGLDDAVELRVSARGYLPQSVSVKASSEPRIALVRGGSVRVRAQGGTGAPVSLLVTADGPTPGLTATAQPPNDGAVLVGLSPGLWRISGNLQVCRGLSDCNFPDLEPTMVRITGDELGEVAVTLRERTTGRALDLWVRGRQRTDTMKLLLIAGTFATPSTQAALEVMLQSPTWTSERSAFTHVPAGDYTLLFQRGREVASVLVRVTETEPERIDVPLPTTWTALE